MKGGGRAQSATERRVKKCENELPPMVPTAYVACGFNTTKIVKTNRRRGNAGLTATGKQP